MTLPELAKLSVETYIKEGKIVYPSDTLPKEFINKRAGVFVSIYTKYKIQNTKYELRGCIGTYLPTRINIAEEIIHNAIAAATEDYRFGPIEDKEFSSLSYTVYILSEPELVKDIKDLDPKKYGIIVKTTPFVYPNEDVVFDGHSPFKSGLLLPGLEEINTIDEQVSIACQKAEINSLKEKVIIYRFTTEKYQ